MRKKYKHIWVAPDENGVSVLDTILRKLVESEQENNHREPKTTMVIVDSKSIQNAATAEEKVWNKNTS